MNKQVFDAQLINFAQSHIGDNSVIGSMLRETMASLNADDDYAHLEPRLANGLRSDSVKPIKIETVPTRFPDELSGDFYNSRALFYADGSIEVVSYKGEGEGEGHFDNEAEYREWVANSLLPKEPDWDDYEGDGYW